MIAASNFVREQTDDFFDLDEETAEFEYTQAFTGCELVHDTHRLALMNAMLHDIQSKIILGDTLSNVGKEMQGYDVVLTNPPFGTKKRRRACNARRLYLSHEQQAAELFAAHLPQPEG